MEHAMLKTRIFSLVAVAAMVATAACAREERTDVNVAGDTTLMMPPMGTDPAMGTGTMPMDTMGMGTTGTMPMDTMGMGTMGTDTMPRP
jgi:hypothetical protein